MLGENSFSPRTHSK